MQFAIDSKRIPLLPGSIARRFRKSIAQMPFAFCFTIHYNWVWQLKQESRQACVSGAAKGAGHDRLRSDYLLGCQCPVCAEKEDR